MPGGEVITDGQIIIGSSVPPNLRVATLTAGPGIAIVNGPGSITISSAGGGGFTWQNVTSATNPNLLANNNGYIVKGAGGVIFVLPAAAALGDEYFIVGYGNLWTITQNALQTINLGFQGSTPGVLGSVSASNIKDSIDIVCVTPNTEFEIINSVGNLIFN